MIIFTKLIKVKSSPQSSGSIATEKATAQSQIKWKSKNPWCWWGVKGELKPCSMVFFGRLAYQGQDHTGANFVALQT